MHSQASKGVSRQLTTYALIGIVVAAIDFTTFRLTLYDFHVPLYIATTIAYTVGVTSHFLLNRYFNFRNFERTIHQQATTYGAIVFAAWLFTLLVVAIGVRLGMGAFPARVLAAVLNFPFGFVCHRYLTFGPGIMATVRRNIQGARD